MNPLAVCALLSIGCAAPKAHARHEVLGMVAGAARLAMQADWDSTSHNARAPERMYRVLRDSLSMWPSGPTGADTIYVLYVLEVERVLARHADPLTFVPAAIPQGPTIHTHQNSCLMRSWGPEYDTCSNTVPESHQCRPSMQDERVQVLIGTAYDVIQCDRNAWVFFFNPKVRA